MSDLHTDYEANMAWTRDLPAAERDILIVAGDVSSELDIFEATMAHLASMFGLVFFVPGNHDLWVRKDGSDGKDSIEKHELLQGICERVRCLKLFTSFSVALIRF